MFDTEHPKRLTCTLAYQRQSRHILTEVILYADTFDTDISLTVRALWDTGAVRSAITPEVMQRLNLAAIDNIAISSANSTSRVDVTAVTVALPNGATIADLPVAVCTIGPNIDMLVGMDIISRGDFAISNGKNRTMFSFAMPPFNEGIDFSKRSSE
jgi:hypothetical protein